MTSLPQLGILLGRELQPDGATSLGDGVLEGGPVFEDAALTPSFVDLHDLVGRGEAELTRQRGAAVLVEEADVPSAPAHEVHEYAMLRGLAAPVHGFHEVGHGEIVSEGKAKLSTAAQGIENTEQPAVLRAVFDPDRLRIDMERNLPNALRDLADAIESGQMDGNLAGFTPWGFKTDHRDSRCHLLVKLHLAADIRRSIEVHQK